MTDEKEGTSRKNGYRNLKDKGLQCLLMACCPHSISRTWQAAIYVLRAILRRLNKMDRVMAAGAHSRVPWPI